MEILSYFFVGGGWLVLGFVFFMRRRKRDGICILHKGKVWTRGGFGELKEITGKISS